jgi:4-hydroxyacetophenone monooxygenase
VVPDYPATGKRTLQDNGSWLRTLTRDNVELVRTGIDRIESNAVVTDDGTRYPADVIVYATGFRANKMLWPMTISGRGGEILSERSASGRRRIWASPCRATRTSSACTGRAPTSHTVAA